MRRHCCGDPQRVLLPLLPNRFQTLGTAPRTTAHTPAPPLPHHHTSVVLLLPHPTPRRAHASLPRTDAARRAAEPRPGMTPTRSPPRRTRTFMCRLPRAARRSWDHRVLVAAIRNAGCTAVEDAPAAAFGFPASFYHLLSRLVSLCPCA